MHNLEELEREFERLRARADELRSYL